MIKKSIIVFLALFACGAHAADSRPKGIIHYHIPNAALVGMGHMTVLTMDIYDIALYAPNGRYASAKPFALRLDYLRDLKGTDIADTSIKEISKQGLADQAVLDDWKRQLYAIIPDVNKGLSLTGIRTAKGETVFYKNQTKIGTINDPLFGKYFFGIWLNEKTADAAMRRQLIGQ